MDNESNKVFKVKTFDYRDFGFRGDYIDDSVINSFIKDKEVIQISTTQSTIEKFGSLKIYNSVTILYKEDIKKEELKNE